MKRILSLLLVTGLIVSVISRGYFSGIDSPVSACEEGWVDTSQCIATECGTSQGTKTQDKYETVCDYSCPTIVFSTEDFGPINVTYDKSSDPNHCHKPTPESLNIPPRARGDYGKLVSELDSIGSNCHQEVIDTRTIACSDAQIIECQVSTTPTPEPTCEWVAESECSALCGGGFQDWYHRGEGCDNAYEQRPCNTQACDPTPGTGECAVDGLNGFLNYTGNHLSTLPVIGEVWNPDESSCSDYAYLHIFGSMNRNPETEGWLESQLHVASYTIVVPEGNQHTAIDQSFDNSEYCWYQVDLATTDEVRVPPYYYGDDMIDYVFVQGTNPECNDPTSTPTPTPTPTTSSGTGGDSDSSSDSSSDTSSDTQGATDQAQVLGATTLADTGSGNDYFLMIGLILTLVSGYGLKKQDFKIKNI